MIFAIAIGSKAVLLVVVVISWHSGNGSDGLHVLVIANFLVRRPCWGRCRVVVVHFVLDWPKGGAKGEDVLEKRNGEVESDLGWGHGDI